jgi:hypothetical protein
LRWSQVTPEDRARVRAEAERQLSSDEWRAYVSQPMDAEERAQVGALLDWFARRYPTPADRLRYARRAFRRWAGK